MFKRALDITYSPVKNNFVLLPEVYLRLINTYVSCYTKNRKKLKFCLASIRQCSIFIFQPNTALQLSFNGKTHCVSWLPYGGAVESHQIGMSAVVADVLGKYP